ncbi:MAG: Hsp33 family molecular chaperone HslO, partial [Lachnospiraceae bacterium]|nr:Hsp33 family molecular chaperone HslO [Lachnospiraceae bacterium]
MSDYIVRATAANAQIRAFAATTRDLVETARKAHDTSPVVSAALGRLMTGGVMMGAMLKGDKDLLTLQVSGDGPLKGMTVTADSKGNVKGYANEPQVMLPPNGLGKLDVGGAVGQGLLRVIKDMGLKEPYVGQTVLQTGEIAEDLTYYFATSEQVPSSVGLGVLMEKDNTVKQAGGFIIQLMPFTDDQVIAALERNLAEFTSVTQVLDEGKTPEEMLGLLLKGLDLEITNTMP